MCQLLAMSCLQPASINFSLEGFHTRGCHTDEHKDGWGMAFFETERPRLFHDHAPAAWSPLLQKVKSEFIKAKLVIAHIRKATYGNVSLRNCHPFARELWGQTWVMSHNGDLHNFNPALEGHFTPEGETDSERAFCLILDTLTANFPWANEWVGPSDHDIFAVLNQLSAQLSNYGSFNVLIGNGDFLFAHCSTKLAYVERRYPFQTATLVDIDLTFDLSAHNAPNDRMIVLATTPLTCNEQWTLMNRGESILLRDGDIVAKSLMAANQPESNVFAIAA